MSEESEHDAADGHDDGHATEQSEAEQAEVEDENENRDRVTSPMQDYSMRQVTTGFGVLLVGVVVAYGLPALF